MPKAKATKPSVQLAIDILNREFGTSYQLDGAYGGWRLWDDATGSDPIGSGFVTKTTLVQLVWAFQRGIRVGKTS